MKDALSLKQCEANILAGFWHYDLPRLVIIATMADRCLFALEQEFLDRLEHLVPIEFEWWPFNRNHGLTAIAGWRERVACFSMQLVQHSTDVLEVDYDRFNPNFGAGPTLLHLCEVLMPGKTDPFRVMKGLQKRGISVDDVRPA